MKKLLIAINGIIVGTTLGILLSLPFKSTTEIDNLYSRTMWVTEVDVETDIVTLVDCNGYEWEFYGVEDWEENDICSCLMDTNGTEIIFDDVIVSTIYNGTR